MKCRQPHDRPQGFLSLDSQPADTATADGACSGIFDSPSLIAVLRLTVASAVDPGGRRSAHRVEPGLGPTNMQASQTRRWAVDETNCVVTRIRGRCRKLCGYG